MIKTIRDRLLFSYLGCFVLLFSVAFRASSSFFDTPFRWWVIGLVTVYTILFASEWIISQHWHFYRGIYFVMQSFLTLVLLLYVPPFDYFSVLFIPLLVQAFWLLKRKNAYILTGIFTFLVSASMIDSFGWQEGIGFALTYTAVFFFVVIVCIMTLRAEAAQEQSQGLLSELSKTHQKLQAYAEQVEELAAAQERSRLARELHDSVTQTIFSMTLTAQSARILLDRDPTRVAGQLDHLQSLAKNALAEMRSLIQQHPRPITADGLAEAVRRHAAERAAKDGLDVDLQISGSLRLPAAAEEALYRVVQEALNNVVKHAGTNQVKVTLCLDQDPAWIAIDDQGAGFDPTQKRAKAGETNETGHLGLLGMEERVAKLGATLKIDSKPGAGTHIRVENIRTKENRNGEFTG